MKVPIKNIPSHIGELMDFGLRYWGNGPNSKINGKMYNFLLTIGI